MTTVVDMPTKPTLGSMSKDLQSTSESGSGTFDMSKLKKKKIVNIEAERVANVIDIFISKLQILHLVNQPSFVSHFIPRCQNETLKQAFLAHCEFIQAFQRKEMAISDFRKCTKMMLRLCLKDQAFMSFLQGYCNNLNQDASSLTPFDSLLQQVKSLREFMLEKLLTTVEEERSHKTLLNTTSMKDLKNRGEIKTLEGELSRLESEHGDRSRALESTITKLRGEIELVSNVTADLIHKIDRETKQKEAAEGQTLASKKDEGQKKIGVLRKELSDLRHKFQESEASARKKKFKIESEIENWINKYDQELGDKHKEMKEIRRLYDDELAQLADLQTRFATLEAEYNAFKEERRLEMERQAAAEAEMRRITSAVTVLQRVWRAYKARKELQKKTEGKKKGKKGSAKGSAKKK